MCPLRQIAGANRTAIPRHTPNINARNMAATSGRPSRSQGEQLSGTGSRPENTDRAQALAPPPGAPNADPLAGYNGALFSKAADARGGHPAGARGRLTERGRPVPLPVPPLECRRQMIRQRARQALYGSLCTAAAGFRPLKKRAHFTAPLAIRQPANMRYIKIEEP